MMIFTESEFVSYSARLCEASAWLRLASVSFVLALLISKICLLAKDEEEEEEVVVGRVRVAVANCGTRFRHAFEATSSDEEWTARYESVLSLLEEERADGKTWREKFDAEEFRRVAYRQIPELDSFERAFTSTRRQKLEALATSVWDCDFAAILNVSNVDEDDYFEDESYEPKMNGHFAVAKRDAGIVLLCRGDRTKKNVYLSPRENFVDLATGMRRNIVESAYESFFEDSSLPSKTRRRGLAAMAETRKRTLGVDVGAFALFAICATQHRECAEYLAKYLGDLASSVSKPTVFLLDCDLSAEDDIDAFEKELKCQGLASQTPPYLTHFNHPTIFRGAPLPPPPKPFRDAPENLAQLYKAYLDSNHDESFEIVKPDQSPGGLPKDRIVLTQADAWFVDTRIEPSHLAKFATGNAADDEKCYLPTQAWPSDHLVPVANLFVHMSRQSPSSFSPSRPA